VGTESPLGAAVTHNSEATPYSALDQTLASVYVSTSAPAEPESNDVSTIEKAFILDKGLLRNTYNYLAIASQ